MNLAAAVLAAGGSTRLGYPKQLVMHQGERLLERAIDRAASLQPTTLWLCLGAHADAIWSQINPKFACRVDVNDWQEGQSAALRAAVKAAIATPEIDALAVLLVDQWQLSAAHLVALKNAHAKHPQQACASHYDGILGVPAIFPRSWFERLLGCHGDQGARLLLRDGTDVHAVPCAAPGDWDLPPD